MPVFNKSKSEKPTAEGGYQADANPYNLEQHVFDHFAPWWSPVRWFQMVAFLFHVPMLLVIALMFAFGCPDRWGIKRDFERLVARLLVWTLMFFVKVFIIMMVVLVAFITYKYRGDIIAELIHRNIYSRLTHP